MIYFIMRKFKIKNSDFPTEYKVEKYTDTLDEANKFLSALSLLEQDDEYVSFFVSAHKFLEPLVLDSEVA